MSVQAEKMFRQKALEKLRSPDQLDELLTVTSTREWLLLLALLVLLVVAAVWALFGTLQTRVVGNGVLIAESNASAPLSAVMYVTLADGQRIQPGMVVSLAPVSVRPEEYGLLLGRVVAVQNTPATLQEMLAVLGNDAFVQTLINRGELIAVRIQLDTDPTTASGYRWTVAGGPPGMVPSGTPLFGTIVVREQRPIELVVP